MNKFKIYSLSLSLLLALQACSAVTTATLPVQLPVRGPIQPLVVNPVSLPGDTEGSPYSFTFTATGGVLPYAWSITPGSLPLDLAIDPASGILSGTVPVGTCPTDASNTPCVYDFTVTVTDSDAAPSTSSMRVGPTPKPVVKSAPAVPKLK